MARGQFSQSKGDVNKQDKIFMCVPQKLAGKCLPSQKKRTRTVEWTGQEKPGGINKPATHQDKGKQTVQRACEIIP